MSLRYTGVVLLFVVGSVQTVSGQDEIIRPDDLGLTDAFGATIVQSGDLCIICAKRQDTETEQEVGAAYIYDKSSGNWALVQKLVPPEPSTDLHFCISADFDGSTIVIGTQESTTEAHAMGTAYLYRRVGSAWKEVQRIVPPYPTSLGRFGWSIALSGDMLVIGAAKTGSNRPVYSDDGVLYLYYFNGEEYELADELKSVLADNYNAFGRFVALSDTTLFVGSFPSTSSHGADVPVYSIASGTFRQISTISRPVYSTQEFGRDLSAIPGYVMIGAPAGSSQGWPAAYIYRYEEPDWILDTKIDPVAYGPAGRFGTPVALSPNYALTSSSSGFETTVQVMGSTRGSWSPDVSVLAGDAYGTTYFGGELSVEGSRALVSSSVGVIDFDLDVVATAVSLHDRPGPSSLQLFPNPASTTITVSIPKTTSGPVSITINDVLGRRVGFRRLPSFGPEQISMDISALVPGVYFITVSDNYRQHTGSFVVQR